MTHRLADLAAMVDAELVGDPDRPIDGIGPLASAGPRDLSFFTRPSYRDQALRSAAGALLVSSDLSPESLAGFSCDLLLCRDPYLALAELLAALFPLAEVEPGIHPQAAVAADAEVDPSARVEAFAVVDVGASVGAGAVVGAHAVIGRNCRIGAGTFLHPHVVVYDGAVLGERVIVHSGVVIGADGFGYAEGAASSRVKLPQIGIVVIEDDVEVGANTTIDRATFDATRIGRGTKIDNLVQIGHNARVGEGSILCGQVGISGSARVGDRVLLAGQVGVAGHLDVGDEAQVAAKSAVFKEVPPGGEVAGIPASAIGAWRRRNALQSRLPAMRAALRELERRVAAIEAAGSEDAAADAGGSGAEGREPE